MKIGGEKVAIVGMGRVGSTAAYTIMLDGLVSELALIDINKDRAEGEALDLRHGMQFTRSAKVTAGDSFRLVEGASIVIIAAGFAQKPGGETRLELLSKNVEVFKEIVPQIVKYNNDCIILVVTNPLDVLTYVTWKLSGFPSCRVFGAGTVLDTARFRYLLGREFRISPKDITAYILGEHGDTEFAWWSGANVAGVALKDLPNYSSAAMDQILKEVKNAAYEVINKKGATFYAIGLVISKIVRAILSDQFRVMTVSSVLQNYHGISNVCLSVPTVVRKNGICEKLDIPLNDEEKKKFHDSAEAVAQAIEKAKRLL